MTQPVPLELFQRGFQDLVSVIPPNAPLSPNSKILPSQLGKTPGKRYQNGVWGGYPWLTHQTTEADVRQWIQDGANIGLAAARFPGVDIDCTDPWLAAEIGRLAERFLGPAPRRIGRAPKVLLQYRTYAPFARMAAIVAYKNGKHLVEVLGAGRQYVVYGTHPSGVPYTWDRTVERTEDLVSVDRDTVNRFFDYLKDTLEVIPGIDVERVGDGRLRDAAAVDQDGLRAPSLEVLEQAVRVIPNREDLFPTREDYIRMGYAIRAAGQEDEERAFFLFGEWAGRYEGEGGRVEGNPETWRSDWRKMKPPYTVGWSWLAGLARAHGFDDASLEFTAEAQETSKLEEVVAERDAAPRFSDRWGADLVIEEHGQSLRYVAATKKWYVWDSGRWVEDGVNLALSLVDQTLARAATRALREGVTPKQQRESLQEARALCSTARQNSVLAKVASDPRIVMRPDAFDTDPLVLNTPGGLVDLTTGAVRPHDPATLCAKMTTVAPDATVATPEWTRFLGEATGGDADLVAYLQTLAGYALTGLTTEQILVFIWGPGGTGKGMFLNTIQEAMGDYARPAAMDTFTAASSDKHPADLAALLGARLVTASETQAGRRWDEAKLKSITGGDRIAARFMRQDFFHYTPTFKLIFAGNHKPEIRDLDAAMRRRIHLVPFIHAPQVVDRLLPTKLRAELPGILAWMLAGCRRWQAEGLVMPAVVRGETEEYFTEQDAYGRWVQEMCTVGPEAAASTEELFQSFRQWANRHGEYVGTAQRLAQAMVLRGFGKWRDPASRRRGFAGIQPMTEVLA